MWRVARNRIGPPESFAAARRYQRAGEPGENLKQLRGGNGQYLVVPGSGNAAFCDGHAEVVTGAQAHSADYFDPKL